MGNKKEKTDIQCIPSGKDTETKTGNGRTRQKRRNEMLGISIGARDIEYRQTNSSVLNPAHLEMLSHRLGLAVPNPTTWTNYCSQHVPTHLSMSHLYLQHHLAQLRQLWGFPAAAPRGRSHLKCDGFSVIHRCNPVTLLTEDPLIRGT